MSQLSSSISLPQLAYKGIPVVTTETLARAYEVKPINIQKNFSVNKDRFVEGRHYYTVSGNDLRELKHRLTESKSVKIARNVNALTLWTERGAARHAKMLNSDKAWDMFELLEETFFRVAAQQPNDGLLSPDLRAELKALVDAKLSMFPDSVQGKARAELWTRFNRRFRIAEYAQLPQEKMADARDYIITLELRAVKGMETKAAPAPALVPAKKPAKPAPMTRELKELAAMQGKIDLLIQTIQLHGLTGYSIGTEKTERELIQSKNAHILAASNCLIMAKQAIKAALA